MAGVQQQARRRQRIEALCSAALRALTGDPRLHLRARGLYRDQRRIPVAAPHLHPDAADDTLADHRGAADGMALRLLHSDPVLHRARCPYEALPRLVFELLEQLRVESLVPPQRPGMRSNLALRFAAWSRQYEAAGLADSALGLLLYTLVHVCRARLNGCAVTDEAVDLIEATRAGIAPLIGQELAVLKRDRRDQAAYADSAVAIALKLQALIEDERSVPGRGNEVDERDDERAAALKFLLDGDAGEDEQVAAAASGRSRVFEDSDDGYRVFTTRYDREVEAASLVRPALLRELRGRLDQAVQRQGVNVTRLARRLAALFAAPARDGWSFGEEEGLVDGRRLARLVSAPGEHRVFRRARYQPRADTLVSLLIDCSGSMRTHIEAVAVLVDVLGRALQLAGIGSEVLGFTTAAWNGGRAQRDWLAAGRPAHPGRLNERLHLVYKNADTGWTRARPAIAALLKADLFREGVDGEAVEWACGRLLGHDATTRVLLVLSDGCPMDTATNLANDTFYLDNHLREVVARYGRQGRVRICGLGVGLDLGPFYRDRLALDLSHGVDHRVFDEIVGLLARTRGA